MDLYYQDLGVASVHVPEESEDFNQMFDERVSSVAAAVGSAITAASDYWRDHWSMPRYAVGLVSRRANAMLQEVDAEDVNDQTLEADAAETDARMSLGMEPSDRLVHDVVAGKMVRYVVSRLREKFGSHIEDTAANRVILHREAVNVIKEMTKNSHRQSHMNRDLPMIVEMALTPTVFAINARMVATNSRTTYRRGYYVPRWNFLSPCVPCLPWACNVSVAPPGK